MRREESWTPLVLAQGRAMLQWAYADVECGAATSYTAADPCPLQPTAYICLFAFIHHIPHRYNDLNIKSGIL